MFYDIGELAMSLDLLELADALTDEHMDYKNATQAETARMLVEDGEGSQLDEILE